MIKLYFTVGEVSTALAFFMKENMPEIFKKTELVFCDTECELPETYNYSDEIRIFWTKNHLIKYVSKLLSSTLYPHPL